MGRSITERETLEKQHASDRIHITNRLPSRVRCKDIQVVNANAKSYILPDDTKNIFLFNPFVGHLLEGVVEQIRFSLVRKPRDLTILYILPTESQDIFLSTKWMRKTFQHSWDGLKLHVHGSVPSEL